MGAEAGQDLLALLCSDLRLLWRQAGGPSLRDLGGRLRLSKSQVGALLNGKIRRPPDWQLVRGLVESFHQYAAEHGRLDKLSLRTAVEEHWRPRYALLEHAFSQPRRPVASDAGLTPESADARPANAKRVRHRPGWVLPALLPTAVAGFSGRAAALKDLDALLPAEQPAGLAPPVAVIGGGAGVGKTTLAVHWSHQVAGHFPDGQLYVNLRGFDSSGSMMSPAEAVRGFLDALDVPAERIPASLDAQLGLYRSLLAGKRVLVVLDNAATVAQVRPLLPGTRSCLTVVTSRNELASLIAVEGAHPLTLDLLTAEESRLMLVGRMGTARIDAEPHAVEEIIGRCGRLPLALAIVAARAVTRRGFPLAALAEELREARGGLDAFDGDDAATDVRAVFSWSHQKLSQDAARLFRLLALHPGPDLSVPAAASIGALPIPSAQPLVAGLARAHLVIEHTPGRYTFQDLLRAYATELAYTVESRGERHAAVLRLLDHYLHTALASARLLHPHRDPISVASAETGTAAVTLTDPQEAMAWFSNEYPVLLAAIELAARDGFDTHAWQLGWALGDYFDRCGLWHDWASSMTIALDAARRLADRSAEAYAHRGLGRACAQMGRLTDAHTHFQQALGISGAALDHSGQAHSHLNLAWMFGQRGQHTEALEHAQRALDHYQTAGHRAGQARALNSVGWRHGRLRRYQQALDCCQQALVLQQEIGDQRGEANTWDSLGYAYHHLGQHQQAIVCYQHAVDLFRAVGDRYYEADTLRHLGDTQFTAGAVEAADQTWRDALDILDPLGHVDAERLRGKLSNPDHETAPVAQASIRASAWA